MDDEERQRERERERERENNTATSQLLFFFLSRYSWWWAKRERGPFCFLVRNSSAWGRKMFLGAGPHGPTIGPLHLAFFPLLFVVSPTRRAIVLSCCSEGKERKKGEIKKQTIITRKLYLKKKGWGSSFRTTKCRTTDISKFKHCEY